MNYETAEEKLRAAGGTRESYGPNGTHNAEEDKRAALELVNPTDLADLPIPERQWLVPDWIPMARATGLYGAGGEGKTLLAQMLATACAIGRPWLGIEVRKCRSLLQFCEDDVEEMWRRQEDINRFYSCSFSDLEAMRWLPRLGRDNTLMVFDGRGRGCLTELFNKLSQCAKDNAAQLIITDTLADVFGGEENQRTQARAFVQAALGSLARETGGAVMALAHPSLSGTINGTGTSGSTGWVGTFRAHLNLATPRTEQGDETEPDIRVLTRGKSNFARRGETIEMRWQSGVFVLAQAAQPLAWIDKRAARDVFLNLLNIMLREKRYVSDNSRAGNYAPRMFAKRPERQRFKEADFKFAMERLFADGAIEIGTYKDAKRRPQSGIFPTTEAEETDDACPAADAEQS